MAGIPQRICTPIPAMEAVLRRGAALYSFPPMLVVPVSPLAKAAEGTVSSFTATAKTHSSGDLVQGTNGLLFPMPVHKVF